MLQLDGSAETSRPQFRPIRSRANFAVAGLGLHAFLSLVMISACAGRIFLLQAAQAHRPVSRTSLRGSDLFFLIGARIHLVVMLFTVIAFLLWFYRARQNLSALRPEPFEHSPAGVVWSFFIPFVNLVQPYSAMREIWQASDPEIAPAESAFYATAPVSPLLLTWWLLFLGRSVVFWAASFARLGNRTHKLVALLTATEIEVVAYVLSILAAVSACVLVLRVRRRQETFAERFAVDIGQVF
jgi:hypothetical protein